MASAVYVFRGRNGFAGLEERLVQKLLVLWRRWRESSLQYKFDRALYKAQGGGSGASTKLPTPGGPPIGG
jgi:hypothetical protein